MNELKQEQIVKRAHALDTCVHRFDVLVKRERQAFYYYQPPSISIAHSLSHIQFFFVDVLSCQSAFASVLFCSFTMFFEIMLHIRNSCKHKICMLPKHNKMHYVKWSKIDNSQMRGKKTGQLNM